MFSKVVDAAPDPLFEHKAFHLVSGLTACALVHYGSMGTENDPTTYSLGPQTKIHIIQVKKNVVIESINSPITLAANYHTRT